MTSNGRLQVVPSIFVIVEKGGKYLLLRRANTGYMDGWYDLPAGHLEAGEGLQAGAVRELKEEAGLIVQPEDLRLIHVYQNHTNQPAYHGYIFYATRWSGHPKITEPDKCDDMGWFSLEKLPNKLLPYTRIALDNLKSDQVSISYHEPNSIRN